MDDPPESRLKAAMRSFLLSGKVLDATSVGVDLAKVLDARTSEEGLPLLIVPRFTDVEYEMSVSVVQGEHRKGDVCPGNKAQQTMLPCSSNPRRLPRVSGGSREG